ncbi:hypothetical protein HDU84_007990 [Entophlyctis sp. JEL0112]|nr:hypothetical protein HDU84_007990 [Entophlyctis sp. JEL0112]
METSWKRLMALYAVAVFALSTVAAADSPFGAHRIHQTDVETPKTKPSLQFVRIFVPPGLVPTAQEAKHRISVTNTTVTTPSSTNTVTTDLNGTDVANLLLQLGGSSLANALGSSFPVSDFFIDDFTLPIGGASLSFDVGFSFEGGKYSGDFSVSESDSTIFALLTFASGFSLQDLANSIDSSLFSSASLPAGLEWSSVLGSIALGSVGIQFSTGVHPQVSQIQVSAVLPGATLGSIKSIDIEVAYTLVQIDINFGDTKSIGFTFSGGVKIGSEEFDIVLTRPDDPAESPSAILSTTQSLGLSTFLSILSIDVPSNLNGGLSISSVEILWDNSTSAHIDEVRVHFNYNAVVVVPLPSFNSSGVISVKPPSYKPDFEITFQFDVNNIPFLLEGTKEGDQLQLTGYEVNASDVISLDDVVQAVDPNDTSFNPITYFKSLVPSGVLDVISFYDAQLDFVDTGSDYAFAFSGIINLGTLLQYPVTGQIMAGKFGGKGFLSVGAVSSFGLIGELIEMATGDPNTPGVDLIEAFDSSLLGLVLSSGQTSTDPGFTFSLEGPLNNHGVSLVEGLNVLFEITAPDCTKVNQTVSAVACPVIGLIFEDSSDPYSIRVGLSKTGISVAGAGPSANFNLNNLASTAESEGKKGLDAFSVTVNSFQFSPDGDLVASPENVQPWDGYNGVNPPTADDLPSNLALGLNIRYSEIPDCPLCSISSNIELYVGANIDGVSSTLVDIEDITFEIALIPLLDMGSGYALWRLDNRDFGTDDVCSPSGLFFHAEQDVDFPLADYLSEYLQTQSKVEPMVFDGYMTFRPQDGLNSIGIRFNRATSFLGITIETEIQFQYSSANDINRRKQYYSNNSPCPSQSCSSGTYDSLGYCTAISVFDKYILYNAESQVVALGFGIDSIFFGLGSVSVELDNIDVLFATDPVHPENFFVYMHAGLKVLFVEVLDATVAISEFTASFSVEANVELASVTVEGQTDLSSSALSAGNTSVSQVPITDQRWDISVYVSVSPFISDAADYVKNVALAVASDCVHVWNTIKTSVSTIVNEVADFFKPGGELNALANKVSDFAVSVFDDIKDIVGKIGTFLNDILGSTLKVLADAGQKIANGDWAGAFTELGNAVGDDVLEVHHDPMEIDVLLSGPALYLTLVWDQAAKILNLPGPTTNMDVRSCKTSQQTALEANQFTFSFSDISQNEILPGIAYVANNNATFTIPPANSTQIAVNIPKNASKDAAENALFIQSQTVTVKSPQLINSTTGLGSTTFSYAFTSIDLQGDINTLNSSLSAQSSAFKVLYKDQFLNGQTQIDADSANLAGYTKLNDPVLNTPPSLEISCTSSIQNLTAALYSSHKPTLSFIEPECNSTNTIFTVTPTGRQPSAAGQCQAVFGFTWVVTDSFSQTVIIHEQPPTFTYMPPDMTLSCESSINVTQTGIPTVSGGCGFDSVNITWVDTRVPVQGQCGSITIYRTFTATQSGCKLTANATQILQIYDKTPPVGTDTYGTPTSYDTCGNAPVRLSFSDSYLYDASCAADKRITRTWKAVDTCGNTAVRNQTISIHNSNHHIGDAALASTFSAFDTNLIGTEIDGQIVSEGNVYGDIVKITPVRNCSYTPYDINAGGEIILLFENHVNATEHAPSPYSLNRMQTSTAMLSFSRQLVALAGFSFNQGPKTVNCTSGSTDNSWTAASVNGLVNSVGSCNATSFYAGNSTGQKSRSDNLFSSKWSWTGIDPYYNIFQIADQDVLGPGLALNFNIVAPSGSIVIINLNDRQFQDILQSPEIVFNVTVSEKSIIWNVNAKHAFEIDFLGGKWPGTIFAPNASISLTGTQLYGQVHALSVSMDGAYVDCSTFYGFRQCADPIFR